VSAFETLQLHPQLLKAVAASGYTAPTAIQQQAIPEVLAGRDLMASAQTGTGKTAAFVLPALHRLLTPASVRGRGPRVLVLTPTRELAMQVTENIRQFGRFTRFVSGSVVGGMPYPPQNRLLAAPLDLLVATPGRLMDHMAQGRVDFARVEMLVLDEADRMLDMGFVDAVQDIAARTPAQRQTLLFSATLEGRVLRVAQALLRDPVRIQLAANHERHAAISQQVHLADDHGHKQRLLAHYLEQPALKQAVVFTATKAGADRLARTLEGQGHAAAPLHGDMNQNQRRRVVEQMKRGSFRLLVATDVAARGLDIRSLSHVINFDLPMVAEDYIHRIGRTGRGGDSGTAISFVGPDDRRKLADIERLTGSRLERSVVAGLEPVRRESAPGPARSKGGGRKPGGPHRAPARSGAAKPAPHRHHAAPGKPARQGDGGWRQRGRNG
jgi:superfamily II DNA/RNA helicase